MKKLILYFPLLFVFILFSCGEKKTDATTSSTSDASKNTGVVQQFSLDTKNSSLKWKGSQTVDHFHTGTLAFKSGSVESNGVSFTGEFLIDMSSMTITDEKMSKGEMEILKETLMDAEFFNSSKFPEVSVKVDEFKEGKLKSTINVLGKPVKRDIPVKMTNDGNKMLISGVFNLDFKELNLEGFKENKENPDETIKSVIEYELNLVLLKK